MVPRPQPEDAPAVSARDPRWVTWVAVIASVAWFFSWSAESTGEFIRPQPASHYDFYVDAVLAGQAHLAIAVAPELVALADPYDPAANAPYRVNDLSYHQGRYYLYLGITPVLVLLAPFKAVTGLYLTERAATLVFCLVGLIAGWALLLNWRRSVTPSAPRWCFTLAAASLLVASGYPAVIRTDGTNQIPIAAAFACGSLALAFTARYLLAAQPRLGWLVASSVCYGLAIGARPNFAPAALCLLVAPFYAWRNGQGWAAVTRILAATCLPIILASIALLAWNETRFGHPLEFGQRLMLGAWDQRALANSSLVSAWNNTVHYLFEPADYHAHFPFVRLPSWHAVGLFLHVPLLGVAAVWGWRSRRYWSHPARSLVCSVALLAGINLLVLIFLPSGNPEAVLTSANSRYVLDFQPYVALLIACAIALAGQGLAQGNTSSTRLALSVSLALAATAIATLSMDLARLPTSSYRRVAELLNLPTWVSERLRGVDYGAINLRLTFPRAQVNSTESILTIGDGDNRTVLYVTYLGPEELRFGLFNTRLGGPESRPIRFEPGREHRLEISIGAFYPPPGSPDYFRLSSSEVLGLLRRVELQLDGQAVLSTIARLDPAAPHTLQLGAAAPWSSPRAQGYTGLLSIEARRPLRSYVPESAETYSYGAVRLTLRFPRDQIGTQEPLVVSGVPQAGNFVYVRYVDSGHVQIGFDHWGTAGVVSPVLAVDYSAQQVIEVDHAGLREKSDPDRLNRVSIRLNGREVLAAERASYPTSPSDITIGINSIGGSTCGYLFTGELIAVERVPSRP